MKRSIASLLITGCLSALVLLWGCDAENLPTAVVSTPTAFATLPVSPTTEQATPTTELPTATPTIAAPTPPPTVPPTLEPTSTATEEPPTATVALEDTPTRAAPAATRARPTRTPTGGVGGDTTPTSVSGAPTQPGTQPTVSEEGPPTGAWSQVVRVAPGKMRIALTFDAGASGETCPDVLATLRQRGIHITMFFTGKFAEQYPDCIKAALADGNEIANHTYSHLDSRTLTDQQLADELGRTEQIIQNLTGATTKPYWRPPFGAYNNHVLQVAAAQGYRSIYWTLDSLDSVGQPKTPDFIYNRVTNPPTGINLDGAIVLQHFGSQASAEALPRELDRLKELGYQVVTISQLLSP